MFKIKRVLTNVLTSQFPLLTVTPHLNRGYLENYQQRGMSSKPNKEH